MTQNADRLLPGAPGGSAARGRQARPAPHLPAPPDVPSTPHVPAPPKAGDVAARTAAHTLAARTAGYPNEVRRLLDAGLAVVIRNGTSSRPRVADIVAEAGLSNDAFYRHFPSKDSLVAALIEEGSERLFSYAAHQITKEPTPEGQVRRWVEAVLAQARGDVAESTLAVMWNGASSGGVDAGRHPAASRLATLLHAPFIALGSDNPEMDSRLAAHATLGTLFDFLWRRRDPTEAELDRVTRFCLRAVAGSPASDGP